jgi:hypothetical protein
MVRFSLISEFASSRNCAPISRCSPSQVAEKPRRRHDGAIMNARTQISMDPELQRRAQARAEELGISFAEYVCRLLASDLGEPKPKADISIVFDLGASDEPTDIARDKDKMIGEAVWEEYLRETGRKPRGRTRPKASRR